jgi:hypothetical protein
MDPRGRTSGGGTSPIAKPSHEEWLRKYNEEARRKHEEPFQPPKSKSQPALVAPSWAGKGLSQTYEHSSRQKEFAKFGVAAGRRPGLVIRNGWSGRNEQTKTVVLNLWEDRYDRDTGTYEIHVHHTNQAGWIWLAEDVAYAQKHTGGVFNVVFSRAEDPNARPRKIATSRANDLKFKVTYFNKEEGIFRAELIKGQQS